MAPTPITLLENSMSSTLFRNGWDSSIHQDHMGDPKAVGGGHFPLSKRNSTPVGIGVNISSSYNSMKGSPLSHNSMGPHGVTGVPGGESSLVNGHRPLDRCHSEPLKPQVQPSMTSSSRYKTELCRPYAETGFCKYGEKCQFAHGGVELRNMPRHPKYKTELCRTFHTTGLCGYGTRCHFIHNAEEARNASSSYGGFRGPEGEIPMQNVTPPSSLHGSPTSPGGAFFGDTFPLINPHCGTLDATPEENGYPLHRFETPPVSPVESLAGDIENLSLSPTLSDSPPPSMAPCHPHQDSYNALMEMRYLRLPIFQSLKEAM